MSVTVAAADLKAHVALQVAKHKASALLCVAVSNGNYAQAQDALSQGADPNCREMVWVGFSESNSSCLLHGCIVHRASCYTAVEKCKVITLQYKRQCLLLNKNSYTGCSNSIAVQIYLTPALHSVCVSKA